MPHPRSTIIIILEKEIDHYALVAYQVFYY